MMSGDEIEHATGKIALIGGSAQIERIALRAGLPLLGRSFVATDMDDLRWEDVHNLREHTFYKIVNLRIAHAEHIFIHAPIVAHLIRAASATQLGIAGQSSQHMAGHIDLGHNGDVALGSISHYVASLLLGVESAVRNAIIQVGIGAQCGARTHGADGSEFGESLDLYSPSLVVGKMPVESVHIVHGQQVDVLLYEIDREEMT